jgi:hypothetical protein
MPTSTSIPVTCNPCGARLRAPKANAGKRLPCPKCGAPIEVPGNAAHAKERVAPGATPDSRRAGVGLPFRGPSQWTAWDRILIRTGVMCIAFGILAHVLPMLGLQFRKLGKLGPAATTGGTGVALIGAFLVGYVIILKGRTLKLLVGAAALAVIGFVGLLTIGYLSSRSGGPTPPMPTGPSPPFAQPAGAPARGQAGPWSGPPSPVFSSPSQHPQRGPMTPMPPPPPIDYDALVQRYGADRVARVTISGASGLDLAATIRKRLEAWDSATRPGTWRVSTTGDAAELLLGPVGDLSALAAALDLGSVTGQDDDQRRLYIAADPGRCEPKP